MPNRWLLYDSGCAVCAALAQEVETLSGGRLGVRSLRDPGVRALLTRARPGWRWEPMLVEMEGERVRVFAGLAMRWRLVQLLGPVRALRAAQAVARIGGPVLGVDWGRRRFLGRALGAFGAFAIGPRLRSVISPFHPPPSSFEKIEILAGSLRAFTDDEVEIETLAGLHKIRIPNGISVWKGGERPLSALTRGDELMIRLHIPSGTALRLWANLTRVQGW